MKRILFTLTALTLSLGSFVNAQSDGRSRAPESTTSDVKANYVRNQDYLSQSALGYKDTYHADSLRGFDETALKAQLLANGVYGGELTNHMANVKRDYINRKYSIGPYSPAAMAAAITNNGGNPGGGNVTGKPMSGGSQINIAPCVNEDFESTPAAQYTSSNAVTGWTINSGANSSQVVSPNNTYGVACNANAIANWAAGSPEFWIVQTPLFGVPSIGTLPNSPLGGTSVAKMNDATAQGNYICTRLRSTFPVTMANTLFQFAYAGSWDGQHECCGQPGFRIDMYQEPCTGSGTPTLMTCSNVSLTPSGPACSSGVPGYTVTSGVSWTNWVVRYIDLTPYIGQCVTIQVTNSDCSYGGHHGSAYFDARCGGQLIGTGLGGNGGNIPGPVSFCSGANVAVVTAPLGYSTYSWIAPNIAPPIPANQATLSVITISNPIPGAVYTVNLTGASGCQFISTNTLVFSQVNIAGIGSTSTCIGGASGSATVQGNGSGSGYNYTWINTATNATISSGSTTGNTMSVNGLAPGVYSVVLTGLGATGCGTDIATTTVTTGPPGIIEVLKPFCGTEAYLGVTGGSNFQWYNGLSAISATAGGNAMTYTVQNPVNQTIYWLSYLSQYGCQDSVKFTLVASTPGILAPPNVSWICPGGTNGTAIFSVSPAPGAPPGINSFSVWSLAGTPSYSAYVYPYASTVYTATGLAAGSYSVKAFDGSCKYGTTFNVVPFVYTWGVTPTTAALCPGQSVAASITWPTPPSAAQYTYSWSPNQFLAGNANTYSSTIITPNIPIGTQTTIVYTVVVTPSLVFCPMTKTIAITAINPATPTITPIPNMCKNAAPYQIQVSPTGGTFNSGITGANNPINSLTGLITPSLTTLGLNNQFTYMIVVGNCSNSSVGNFEMSQFNPATLTSTVPPQCVTNAPFNLMNIVLSATNGTWSGSGVQGTNFNAAALNGNIFSAPFYQNNYTLTYSTTSSPNPTVCPHSQQVGVAVTKTMTPTILQMPQFCTNSAQKNMTVSPVGGSWYSNAAVSAGGVITPTFALVPSSTAFYSIAIGPCINIASTQLNASTFFPAGFTGTVNNLCVTSPVVNLMGIVQSTNGSWLSGPGVQSNSFIPSSLSSFTNITADTYVLTYTVPSSPNVTLCPDSRTLAISFLNPPAPNIANVGPLCSIYAPVQLTVSPAVGYWTSSSYLSPTGVFTPSLGSVGNNAVQYVIGTNTCNTQQTKFISVEAYVSAKITSQLPDQCNNGPIVNLTPFSGSGLGTWMGPGVNGSSFNPGLTGSGSFTLMHKTASSPSGLCPDEDVMAVNVFSLATPQLGKLGPYCNNALPVQIPVSPVGGIFGGAGMGAVTLEGKFSPGSAIIGDNIINYSITSGPCIAYGQSTISVEKFVSASFDRSVSPICLIPGKTSAVNMNGYVENPGMFWEGDGIIKNTSMFDPNLAKPGKNNKVTYYTHSMPTATLCPDKKEIFIEVRKMPEMKAIGTGGGCLPAEIVFNTPDAPEQVGVGTWNFDDGSEPQQGLYVTHVYTVAGTFNATFTYKDDIGCEALPVKVSPVVVHNTPKADFSVPEEIYISNPEVQLTNLTTVLGDNTYQWKIANLYTMEDVNPVVTFPKIGKYQITLTATTPLAAGGCTDQVTKTIEIKNDFNIYIPSSFSPNFDGLNDIFIPVFSEYGLDTKSFEMEIFDRWGHSIYRTKDITKGWDGSVANKGEPLKEEVYIYRIKYKDLDGNAYSKMGHVTLLK